MDALISAKEDFAARLLRWFAEAGRAFPAGRRKLMEHLGWKQNRR